MTAGLISSETSPFGLQMAIYLVCPHMDFSLCVPMSGVSHIFLKVQDILN